MTVSSAVNRVSPAGDGVTTAFSYPYYYLDKGDLKVILKVNLTGVETVQTITSDYTVSPDGPSEEGGTVTMLTAPADGETLVIYRDPALTQAADYTDNDPFPAATHEQALDRQTMHNIRTREMVAQSPRIPDGESWTGTIPNVVDRKGKFFYFDASTGEPSVVDLPTSVSELATPILDYTAYGSGHTALNSAITFVSSRGGGTVFVPQSATFSGQIIGKDKVYLWAPLGVVLTLDTDLIGEAVNAFIYGADVPNFTIGGGGQLRIAGNADYAVRIAGESKFPIDGLEIRDHKGGVRIEANATSGIGHVVIRDLHVHDNFVHPTDAANLSKAGHGLSISCRPSQGFDLTESVTLDNIRIEGVAQGATDGDNQYTKDLLTIQGAKRVIGDGALLKDSGEVGCSISFGCRDVDLHNFVVTGADGNGIYASGSHWRLDVTSVSGTFQVGEDVTGGTSGAVAEIEYLPAAGIIWVYDSAGTFSQFSVGETITGGTSGATATVSVNNYMRDIRVHPSCRTENCGLDAAATGATLAGLQAARVRDVGLGGHHKDSPIGVRVARSTGFEAGHLTYDGNTTDFSAVSTQWISREQELILDTAADPSEQLANVRRYRYKVQTAATSTATPWSYTLTNDEILAVRVKVIWSNTSYANNGYQVIDALFKKDGASAAAQVGSTVETVNIETTASAGAELNLTTSTIELDLVSVSGSAIDWFVEIETMTFADAIE